MVTSVMMLLSWWRCLLSAVSYLFGGVFGDISGSLLLGDFVTIVI